MATKLVKGPHGLTTLAVDVLCPVCRRSMTITARSNGMDVYAMPRRRWCRAGLRLPAC